MISTINCNEAKKVAKTAIDITSKKSSRSQTPLRTISSVKSLDQKQLVALLDRAKKEGNDLYSNCLHECLNGSQS